jgi:sulfofructosephosphate aldolase
VTGKQGSNVTQAAGAASSALLARLQTPGGHYAMLALDQRESLRGMFARPHAGGFADDGKLRSFKKLGVELLTPYASAVLLDRPFGLEAHRPRHIAPNCGLIVAVDVLHQEPGDEITHVTFDNLVTVDLLRRVQADAIKLLVLWHRRTGQSERAELVRKALDLAAAAGVATLVEGIVRPEPGRSWSSHSERHDAILACADELTRFEPDIYKAQVPGYSRGDVSLVAEQSAQMTAIVGRDWVVLSNGVERDMFAAAVTEARRGGANGFLAGRAIWADTVAAPDVAAALRSRSIDRLTQLTTIVDAKV